MVLYKLLIVERWKLFVNLGNKFKNFFCFFLFTFLFRYGEYSNRSDLNRACFTGTDKYVMAGGSNGKIYIWETETGELHDSTSRVR